MYRPFSEFQPVGGFISVIGSGGKTTLLSVLSRRLPGRVILTTSTHIYPFPGIPLAQTPEELHAALSRSPPPLDGAQRQRAASTESSTKKSGVVTGWAMLTRAWTA